MRKKLTLDEAFRSNFAAQGDDDCWEWTGFRAESGAGHARLFHEGKFYTAHRLAYELYNGVSLTRNVMVLHRCDNRACVNPAHLFLGTQRDNMRDMVAKGRHARNTGKKLTDAQAREVHRLFLAGVNKSQLARDFGMIRKNIIFMLRGDTYRHIYEEFRSPSPSAPAAVAA